MIDRAKHSAANFFHEPGVALAAFIAMALGLVSLGGCSTPTGAAGNDQMIEMSFDLQQCQSIGVNIYKCPAIDKPICTPDYSPTTDIQCIRLGKKGSVMVGQVQ
jgi:hypothetical protein